MTFTLLDAGRAVEATARIAGDRVTIPAADVERELGLTLTPEGLCGEGFCIPVADAFGLRGHARTQLRPGADAAVLRIKGTQKALAVTADCNSLYCVLNPYLGAASGERRRALGSLHAPDFSLPDLAGRLHSLSEHLGKKVLLVAHASW